MAEAQVFIIDASVAVKWYVSEELRDKALRLREDFLSEIVDLEAPVSYSTKSAMQLGITQAPLSTNARAP